MDREWAEIDMSVTIAAAIENGEPEKICETLLENSEYFNNPERNEQKSALILYFLVNVVVADIEKKEEVVKLLISFLKFEDSEKKYFDAIYEGNVKSAESYLKNGTRFEEQEWKKNLQVNWIFLRKNINTRKEMLEMHLKYGLDTEFKNRFKKNLLNIFIDHVESDDNDAVEVAKILMNSGVSFNDYNHRGSSPWFNSIEKQNIELVKLFLEKGANVNVRNKYQSFPLLKAAEHDNKELFELLLSNGADIRAKRNDGQTALHEACYNTSKQIVSLLLRKGAEIDALNDDDETPLSVFIDFLGKDDDWNQCLLAMLKGFAERVLEKIPVSKTDIKAITKNQKIKKLFDMCLHELNQMAKTKFYAAHSYYSVLKMSNDINKLAALTKNEEFVKKFEAGLEEFSYYNSDLKSILEEAIKSDMKQ